jgi:hypothetical protein
VGAEEDFAIKRFKISRNTTLGTHKFKEIFSGFEDSPAIRRLFKAQREIDELRELDLELTTTDVWYMRVRDVDGRLLIRPDYLRRGKKEFIYLDLIHELTHIKQFKQGYDLYDQRYTYIRRPTELEAFSNAIAEARRIGLSDLEIYEYMRVDWISESELKELAERLGVASADKSG